MAAVAAAPGSIFCRQLLFSLLVLLLFCDACEKISLQVPSHFQADTLVGKANLKACLPSASLILSSDPDFRVLEDGSIYATRDLILSSERKSFYILLSDSQKQDQKEIEIVLEAREKKLPKKRLAKDTVLKRSKRRWAPIPCSLMENSLGPFPQHVQQVQSDAAQNYTIFYSISGPGVDKEPFNLFFIDKDTGDIFCTRSIDREQYEQFSLYAYATTADGYAPEYPLPLLFKVEDDNDNAPYFESKVTIFKVLENCRPGTSVGQVTAIDLDEPGTLHTRLKFRILQQIPDHPKHFSIHPDTGVITTISPLLDREKCDTYQLIMEVRDMAGQPFGLFNTGTITISLEDENDNPPCFTQNSYFAEVEENRIDVEILRMTVHDHDLPNTPYSKAIYKILQGNENGNFKISTDPNTNEAVLCVFKPLNYEVNRQVVLQIGVLNEVQFSKATNSQTPTMCTTTVTVTVKDSDEGPECHPPVKVIQSRDGFPIGKEILGYKALDPETHSGEGLRYKKIRDDGNWFEINEYTGDLRTIKVLDRESEFVRNDQYNVSVVAMDADGRSCTGTLMVLLEDYNDHPPQIQRDLTICQQNSDFVILEPEDLDGPENGPPFQFFLDNSAIKLWTIESKDGRTAFLRQRQNLDYNYYPVPIQIKDRHGLTAKHVLSVRVCECTTPSECSMTVKGVRDLKPSNVILGRWAILAMVLGSALLLCILFTLFCVTVKRTVKKCFPDVAQQNLIVSNTEGPGEEVTEANIRLPTQTSNICDTSMCVGTLGGQGVKTQQNFEMIKGCYTLDSSKGGGPQTMECCQDGGQGATDDSRCAYTEWHSFTQPRLGEKVYLCGQDEYKRSEDYVRSYDYEGKGSVAGSIGCCSDRQEEEGLEFLDHLEPKFRTLAKTYVKK
ncbi:desmocollin-1 isoform X1 [Manis pentadactyla]|uniref:desmocollin-1 isoform X1 n=1 Tax=Manis pentadactyla TaxID=143292 RepID=UPI00255C5ED7|nr:desmocollin-1 isoform X1 [Manis pentadactyla]KAI5279141.1 Desmocollin-1 [Manis pentadactyla]